MHSTKMCLCPVLLLLGTVLMMSSVAHAQQCPNGCSNRGLCINNACVCAEGLSGADCSTQAAYSQPTLYQCPTCYAITVGPPRYISGPSWRLPDGPIVGLNYKGTLSVFQGNGNGEMISQGQSIDDYLASPINALLGGSSSNYDSCGSWIMRALTGDSGKVLGFYHAETQCSYENNGQTRKSAGYSVSTDGGKTFTKPNYPNNKLLDTSTPIIKGQPSGEGDISVIAKGSYYYLFFGNVEDWHTGVARAARSGDGAPGTFYKYLNGQWNSPSVGGNSSALLNVAGTQMYLHTPSQSILSVGNNNPYWGTGFMLSVSDDAINWKYFADPLFTPDPITNLDTVLYPSFLGKTGGYDVGSSFQLYYLWVAPWSDLTHRYQITKDVTLTYVGNNYTLPSTKIALTTFQADDTGELWQSTELALPPYQAIGIVGYLMSRPYAHSFVVYDCYNYTAKDHFVGTADECFLSGSGVEALRTLGHMWRVRVAQSIAVYRCYKGNDIFLSANTNCDGKAPSQTTPFGYVMDGPAFVVTQDILIGQGATWKFYNKSLSSSWTAASFDDSAWLKAVTPFGNQYLTSKSYFGSTNYYFRYQFNLPAGKVVKKLLLSAASDDFATVYLNGVLVDTDPASWHEASYWNRRVYINSAPLVAGSNTLAVLVKNYDTWGYFDLQLVAFYDTAKSTRSFVPVLEEAAPVEPAQSETATEESAQHGRNIEPRAALVTLLDKGSKWKFYNKSAPTGSWTQLSFDDSAWLSASAPFVTGYSAYVGKTPFGAADHYFRARFTVPAGQTVTQMQVNVASDNYAIVYINGVQIDADTVTWHQATYWNRQINAPVANVKAGENIVAVVVKNSDAWAFFDLQIQYDFTTTTTTVGGTPSPILVDKGSTWAFYNKSAPANTWNTQSFDDSTWLVAPAPFVTGYAAYVNKTPFGSKDYYFRKKFTIPSGYSVASMTLNVASDNYAIVYINGVLVDSDPATWHQAAYWNRQITLTSTSMLVAGTNTIAVVTKNSDAWAFFDLQLTATYSTSSSSSSGVATAAPTTKPTASPTTIPTSLGNSTLIAKGSNWQYFTASPAGTWNQLSFDDSSWTSAPAPFTTGYAAYSSVKHTEFGAKDYYFRSKFTIATDKTVQALFVAVASDNYAIVYINGVQVDADVATWHEAKYWNRQFSVPASKVTPGTNVIAVVVKNADAWAFFDLELVVNYGTSGSGSTSAPTAAPTSAPPPVTPVTSCAIKGQLSNGKCVCESGWGGADCGVNLCTYSGSTTSTIISAGTVYRHMQWAVVASTPAGWFTPTYDDSWWQQAYAPFATSMYPFKTTVIAGFRHLYRKKFTITVPSGQVVQSATLSIGSEDVHRAYVNGCFIDKPIYPYNPNSLGKQWNAVVNVEPSLLVSGTNTIAVEVPLVDGRWTSYFDLKLDVTFGTKACRTS